MTIFVSTTFGPLGSNATEVVDLMLAHDLRRIELGSTHCHEDGLVEALRRRPAEFLVHNYFPPSLESFVVNIASLNDALRDKSIAHVMESIAFARAIGAGLYTFHPGFVSDPEGPSRSATSHDFQFRAGATGDGAYRTAAARMTEACRRIVAYARGQGVRLAVESQGSVGKADRLLLQRPAEFLALFQAVPDPLLGINLNLGHLNLAARAFGFDRFECIRRLADRVVAIELNHNDGWEDEHHLPVEGAWYWPLLRDPGLAHVPVIIEVRDTPLAAVRGAVRRLEAARKDVHALS